MQPTATRAVAGSLHPPPTLPHHPLRTRGRGQQVVRQGLCRIVRPCPAKEVHARQVDVRHGKGLGLVSTAVESKQAWGMAKVSCAWSGCARQVRHPQ